MKLYELHYKISTIQLTGPGSPSLASMKLNIMLFPNLIKEETFCLYEVIGTGISGGGLSRTGHEGLQVPSIAWRNAKAKDFLLYFCS